GHARLAGHLECGRGLWHSLSAAVHDTVQVEHGQVVVLVERPFGNVKHPGALGAAQWAATATAWAEPRSAPRLTSSACSWAMSAPRTGWPACTACAEAIPAASPIANDGGITRTAANASWVAEMHRPVTSSPSSCAGTRLR